MSLRIFLTGLFFASLDFRRPAPKTSSQMLGLLGPVGIQASFHLADSALNSEP